MRVVCTRFFILLEALSFWPKNEGAVRPPDRHPSRLLPGLEPGPYSAWFKSRPFRVTADGWQRQAQSGPQTRFIAFGNPLRSLPMVLPIRHRQSLRRAFGLAAATRADCYLVLNQARTSALPLPPTTSGWMGCYQAEMTCDVVGMQSSHQCTSVDRSILRGRCCRSTRRCCPARASRSAFAGAGAGRRCPTRSW